MSWSQRAYARVSPKLAHGRFSAHTTRLHAWLIRKTGGRVGARFFGGAPLLVLRTVGRRTGQPRENPVIYIKVCEGAWAVAASNAASARFPAWYHNLRADPEVEVLVEGRWRRAVARKAEGAEAEQLTQRIEEVYEGAEHYARIATRELPVVVLEER